MQESEYFLREEKNCKKHVYVTTLVQWLTQVPLGLAHHYRRCTLKNYSQEGADYQT